MLGGLDYIFFQFNHQMPNAVMKKSIFCAKIQFLAPKFTMKSYIKPMVSMAQPCDQPPGSAKAGGLQCEEQQRGERRLVKVLVACHDGAWALHGCCDAEKNHGGRVEKMEKTGGLR